MVLEQKIEIKIENNNFEFGTLLISSKIKTESENEFSNIESKSITGMSFEYIEKDYILNNTTPIQYCPLTSHSTDIFLLEETEYNISFIANEKLNCLDEIVTFDYLKQHSFGESNISFNHWNNIWFANVNFRGYVGKTFIDIIFTDFKFSLMVEIRTKKLNYENEYSEMIADLSEYSSGLMFNINSSLYQNHIKSNKSQTTLYEYYMILEYLFRPQNLPSVVEYLSRHLYSLLDTTNELVPTPFASNIGAEEIAELSSNPQQFHETTEKYSIYKDYEGKHYAPLMIKEMTHKENIDVPENRFYKFFLEFIRDLIIDLYNSIDEGYVKLSLKDFRDNINLFLSNNYFNGISRLDYIPLNSQVLQKKEGYREILEYYLMFEFGLKICFDDLTDNFRGFEKQLGKTYEIWCYFKLIGILNNLTKSSCDFDTFIDLNSWSLTLSNINVLDYFNTLKIDENKEVKITLLYNYEFNRPKNDESNITYSSYSLPLNPDYTLVIEYENNKKLLHFDAKYRVNKYNEYKEDNIHKMHTYKDGITDSIGAYILYPGNKSEVFDEIDGSFGSVGAFTLKPGETETDEKEIGKFIVGIIEGWIKDNSD